MSLQFNNNQAGRDINNTTNIFFCDTINNYYYNGVRKSSNEEIDITSTKSIMYSLPENDSVKKLIDSSEMAMVNGDCLKSIEISEQALAKAIDLADGSSMSADRIVCAKFACIMCMSLYRNYFDVALKYISEIASSKFLSEHKKSLSLLYIKLAEICLLGRHSLPEARAALIKATEFDITYYYACNITRLSALIELYTNNYKGAIDLFQKSIDSLYLKIRTSKYEDNGEKYKDEQNLSAVYSDIASAYEESHNIPKALDSLAEAVEIARKANCKYETAVYLNHWADILYSISDFYGAIEKASEAVKLFEELKNTQAISKISELLGCSFCALKDYTNAEKAFERSLNTAENTNDKIKNCQNIINIVSKSGDINRLDDKLRYLADIYTEAGIKLPDWFEDWSNELYNTCESVVPTDFVDIPNITYMFDESNPQFDELRKQYFEAVENSTDDADHDSKVISFFKQIENNVNIKMKSNNDDQYKSILKKIDTDISDCKSTSEKMQLLYEKAAVFIKNNEIEKSDELLMQILSCSEATSYTRMWASISHAQNLMFNKTVESDNEAKNILDKVKTEFVNYKNYEAIAFCEFNNGRLEARKGNFDNALNSFNKSLDALKKCNIHIPEMSNEIHNRISDVLQYKKINDTPSEDLESLQCELLWLQNWYPLYSQKITEYWYFFRGREILNNVKISGKGACVVYSDDLDIIKWYSEALHPLFQICLYSPKSSWTEKDNIMISTFPAPANTPFPYSEMRVIDPDENNQEHGKRYGFFIASDGTSNNYNVKRIADNELFDNHRIPPPITLSRIGYNLPKMVTEFKPSTDDFGASRWWIAAEFGGTPNGLLNLVSRFGTLPVFSYDDIKNSDDVKIIKTEQVSFPFITEETELKKSSKLQRKLKQLTISSDEEKIYAQYDDIIDYLDKLSSEYDNLVYVDFAIIQFKYFIWSESPKQDKIYPAILIKPRNEFENRKIDTAIKNSIYKRDITSIILDIKFMSEFKNDSDIEFLIKKEETLLELAKKTQDTELINNTKDVLAHLYDVCRY
jgi:tetratricopeptide (TPR) repeat protein